MANDKYINFDIDDPRAGAIAEVMSNKTSKKILGLIAEREMTASDISAELKLPLNTIGYNIDKLLKAGLIEEIKGSFWSVKGKKMNKYKISNKKIVISPKRIISAAPIAVIVALIAIFAIVFVSNYSNNGGIVLGNNSNQEVFKTFNSQQELNDYIKDNSQQSGVFDYFAKNRMATVSAPTAGIAESLDSSSTGGSSYSGTNIQVAGVDEADIVKNDGKYIYTTSGNKVIIVDAHPADGMSNISEININGSINGLFVNEDKLIVITYSYDYGSIISYRSEKNIATDSRIGICPVGGCGGGTAMTNIFVYDIVDRNNPELINNISMEGNYITARMIGDTVYLVSNKYAYSDSLPPVVIMNGVTKEVAATDIYYYPGYYDSGFTFTNILALDIENAESNNKVYLTGYSGTIYASEDNIYLTYQKTISSIDYNKKLVEEAIIPILPSELKQKIETLDSNANYNEIMDVVQSYSMDLEGKEKEEFDSRLQKSMNDFANNIAKDTEKVIIMKVGIDGNEIAHEGSGEVPGHLLNQFSLDEFEGNLRVATTTGQSWNGDSLNHLFVLDEDMEVIGSVQGLASGESIYSVRFMGDRAYIVTFKKVDPFYVIDLSDAENPTVLGYLKIPGYSDYLHPYDENHIIGIGKGAIESQRGDFAYYQGMKISMFDVTDFANPKEVAMIEIGDRGTDSPITYDHKALLFDKEKNLLVIPIMLAEIDETRYTQDQIEQGVAYGDVVYQGAFVFEITENSIKLRGNITHIDNTFNYTYAQDEEIGAERIDWSGNVWKKTAINTWENMEITQSSVDYYYDRYYTDEQVDNFPGGAAEYRYRYSDYRNQIQRSLYIDNVLYTISQNNIKANDLANLDEIKAISIGVKQNDYYGGVYY